MEPAPGQVDSMAPQEEEQDQVETLVVEAVEVLPLVRPHQSNTEPQAPQAVNLVEAAVSLEPVVLVREVVTLEEVICTI